MIEWGYEEKKDVLKITTFNLLFVIIFPNTKDLWTGGRFGRRKRAEFG